MVHLDSSLSPPVWPEVSIADFDCPKSRTPRVPEPPPAELDWEKELEAWPALEWPAEPIRPAPPTRRAIWQVRALSLVGFIGLVAFFVWLFLPARRGDAWLFWPLALGFVYHGCCYLFEWANYCRPKFEPFAAARRKWTVDVLTTACPGEPRGMILRTLRAMKAIRYPHRDVLCDEGDDPLLREACRQLGITHVTRKIKTDAKAGNINNALAQCTGEIAVVLDPDHEPSPDLIDRVLGYFEDEGVGFVQSVQAYRNQKDSFVADGAAKQTYLFYGPIMIGMHAYGTTQAIGANCVFRRAALDSIGGHATGLAEDMHTTMCLYSKGWRSVYIPEILTRGLVPSTLSAYCKQQLKWSFGSVELLLQKYPKLWRGMTGWQRLQYLMGPLYFTRGLFAAIDLAVPIVCLFFGAVAMRVDLQGFFGMYAPVAIVATVVRQLTQCWTIEERERGAHLIGGLLGAGCWFVFLQGFVCAITRRHLTYHPTPKGDDIVDSWRLVVPNLAAAALSLAAIGYGLTVDWTPFSLFMAAFALLNTAQLLFVAALGQQRTLARVAWFFVQRDWAGRAFWLLEKARFSVHAAAIRLMRERSLAVAVPVVATALLINLWPRPRMPREAPGEAFKETGGFYVGINLPESNSGVYPEPLARIGHDLGTSPRLFAFEQKWGPKSLADFPQNAMREARRRGAVPLITWTPWTSTFPELRADRELSADRGVCAAILRGQFDEYLASYAGKIREFGDPVLIRFAPLADTGTAPWGEAGGNTPAQYVQAWIYVVSVFNKHGTTNAGWVWNPATPAALDTHFPGLAYVDWIGLPAQNRGTLGGGKWREFAELYRPFREKIERLNLPVMLTEFGTTESGGSRAAWLEKAFASIATDFPEIRGLVLPGKRGGWFADDTPATTHALAAGLARPALREIPPPPLEPATGLWREKERVAYHSPFITGEAGNFQLTADGAPFYIRGVAYNPGHDWRDGATPLTRRELHADFDQLQALGANTIRRYGGGIYDRNLLRAANEKGMKVLYGFWLEQDVDYLSNSAKRAAYEARVESTVRARRDDPAILAWSVGNEVWGLLKHRYAQPYLTEIRHAHVDYVEHLAQRIHALDPHHPVFAAHEHSPQLAGTLADFSRGAPSLDFTGVNSYYDERMSELAAIATRFDPARPYLVSEFGSDGYWDARLTPHDAAGALVEPSSDEKASSYERGWTLRTLAHRGRNIGGVAYCWRDRFEATATWFGLTDWQHRPKPAYFALQRLWTGHAVPEGPRILALEAPRETLAPGATFAVRAHVKSKNGARCEWLLGTEEFEMDAGRVRASGDGMTAQITVPKKPGTYRLYLTASDGRASDEANVALTVARGGSLSPPLAREASEPRRIALHEKE